MSKYCIHLEYSLLVYCFKYGILIWSLIGSYRGFDFISLEIDGVTETDFFCSFEGLYYYAFYLVEIMWGLLWLYDFTLTLKNPSLYTGKYLMYYCVAAYFVSFGFSICSYFQNNNNFTSVNILEYFITLYYRIQI